jgi:hypothetical protein
MTKRIIDTADRVAVAAAHAMTRRRFVRNTGAGALGIALGATLTGVRPQSAFAMGSRSHPCGPSPITSVCSNNNCNPPLACGRRAYATYTCSGASNCWHEDYRSSGGGLWSCCDICIDHGSGSRCSGNCNQSALRAAICRERIG